MNSAINEQNGGQWHELNVAGLYRSHIRGWGKMREKIKRMGKGAK